MSRFFFASIIAFIAFFAIGAWLRGWTRIWAFTGLWTVYLTLVGLGVSYIQLNFFCPAMCRARLGGMKVALTFDDGPDPAATPALLDLLKREKIPATFFCIGKNVTAYPTLAARIVAEGHVLANHTFNHATWTPFMTGRGLAREISRTQDAIREAAGVVPIYFRPPVGLTNPHYPGVLRRAGLKLVGWDVRSGDTFRQPSAVVKHVLRQARGGSIILLHDGGMSSGTLVETTMAIIEGLREKGMSFARLDEMAVDTDGSN